MTQSPALMYSSLSLTRGLRLPYLPAGTALAQEFPGIIVAPVFRSPLDAKSYIAELEFFADARARLKEDVTAAMADADDQLDAYRRQITELNRQL